MTEKTRESTFGGVGGEWRRRARDRGMQTGVEDGSETRSVTKKNEKKNRRLVSVPASPELQV